MLNQLHDLLTAMTRVLEMLWVSLWPNPGLYKLLGVYHGWGLRLTLGVPLIGGLSLLVGYGGTLLRQGVRRRELILGLLRYGVFLVAGALVMGVGIWLGGQVLFPQGPSWRMVVTFMALSYAPLALGVLMLLPVGGTVIEHVLYTWSALVLLVALQAAYGTTVIAAVACVGMAYVLRLLVTRLGRQGWQGRP